MFAQCQIIFGVNVVALKFETDEPLSPNMSFKTGNVVDNIGGVGGVYTGTASNGSTDGTIEQDYKSPVIQQINSKSAQLLQEGADYTTPSNGTLRFPLALDQQPYLNAVRHYIEYGADLSLGANQIRILTTSGQSYTFENNADYQGWFEAVFARAREIENDNTDLIDQVRSEANTSEAMAPIITANNARS